MRWCGVQARGRTGEEPIWAAIVAESAAVEQQRRVAIRRAILREPLWRTLLTGAIFSRAAVSVAVRYAPLRAASAHRGSCPVAPFSS